MAGITGNIIVSTTDTNVSVQEGNVANIIVTEEQTNITLVAGSVFFPYDSILRDLIPGSNGVQTLGNVTRYWDHLYVESITASNIVSIGGNTTIGGDANISGSLTGPISDPYGVVSTGTLRGFNYLDVIPEGGDTYTLGNSSNRWDELYSREIRADFYEGRQVGTPVPYNPAIANAMVLNTTSLMHRGNAIYMDSNQGALTSDEKTVIGSGGAEGNRSGAVNGILFDNAANVVSVGFGINLQNPANSSVSRGIKIDIGNSNVSILGTSNLFVSAIFSDTIRGGAITAYGDGFFGDGGGLSNITGANISGLTTTDVAEGANLYYTTARANDAISAYTGTMLNVGEIDSSSNITAFNALIAENGGVQATSGTSNFSDANVSGRFNVDGNINLQSGQIDITNNLNAGAFYVTGDSTIVGNLEVQGNIDYVNVVDLLVNDQSITLNYGNASARDAFIYVDRSGSALTNAHLKWNEVSDQWEIFDGTSTFKIPTSTDDLAEGTNLYWTTDRGNTNSDAWLTTKTTDDLTEGVANLYYTDARARAAISSTGNINYDANTGVISESLTTTDIDEGDNLYFTTDRANSAIDDYVVGSENIDVSSGVISLANNLANVNKITSETSTALTLYGEGGIELNQKVDSTESRIVDVSTTGYSLTDATIPADFTLGTATPGFLTLITTTAGTNTATASSPIGISYFPALRGPTYATPMFTLAQTLEAVVTTAGSSWPAQPPFGLQTANGLNNPGAGLYGQDKGWYVYNASTAGFADIFPANAYVTDITNNTITFSQNAIANVTSQSVVFFPGMAQTSSSNVQLKYYDSKITGANAEPIGLYGRLSAFDQPQTLANLTFDAVSYGNTTSVTMSEVNTKNLSDLTNGDEGATRFTRGLLIGPSTTPDAFSGRVETNGPSALGVILENDGETYAGNNAPAARFLINSYSGNLDDLTEYPTWAITGQTGNLSLDLPQLKAPTLQLKAFRGAKSTGNVSSYKLQAGDVVGKIVFSPGQTDGASVQGGDLVNGPSGITVDVGDANVTYVANAYMHITTTPDPGTNLGYMRNKANVEGGANQQTNFTTKGGNVTIAAQTNGMISLAPTPDYGDAANSTVWTRYPGTTHEYHRFMDVGFADKTNKAGTLVELQPLSGQTTGGGGLAYDSVGDVTLKLTTHNSNTSVKTYWEITNENLGGNLQFSQDGNDRVEFASDGVYVNGNIDLSTNATITYDVAHAHLYKTANVTAVAANTAYAFDWTNDVTVESSALITVSDTSRLNFDRTGIYNVALQWQIRNDDNALRIAYIWLRKNGTDVPNSTSRLGITPKGSAIASFQLSTLEYQVDVTAGDYVEVMFAVDDTSGISIEYQPAETTPYARPAVASAVLLIEPVGA